MDFLKTVKNSGQARCPSNLLALDFATTGVKAVRLREVKGRVELVAADILPACKPDAEEGPVLPKSLVAYYVSMCATMDHVMLRVFDQVLPEEADIEAAVRENLSAPPGSRVGGIVLSQGKAKRESTLLGVSVPEQTVQNYLGFFFSGAPAPHSIEISGLAAFSAFLFNRGSQTENQTICLIETGARYTYVAFLHRNQLQMVNRFDVGADALLRQVQLTLGVDAEMAQQILTGGTVNVLAQIRQVLNPFTRQLSISREFVERQNKSAVSAVYLSGGLADAPCWQTSIKEVFGSIPQVWSPFENMDLPDGVFPDHLKGQEPRFAAAVGAALAGMDAL